MTNRRMYTRLLWPVALALTGCGDSGQADDGGSTEASTATSDDPLTLHAPDPPTTTDLGPPVTTTEDTTGDTVADTIADTSSSGSDTGAGTTGVDAPPGDCEVLRQNVEDVLQARCAGCHTGANAKKFDYVDDLGRLVDEGKIVMGDPVGSQLYQRVETDSMPQGGPPLTDYEKLELRAWIAECTPPEGPVSCADNPFISTDVMIEQMRVSVFTDVEISAQPFIRFFTLTHLYNAGMCDDEIDVYRHALVKLLNSLSNSDEIPPLASIDAEDTIYRIDLRDYGWEAEAPDAVDVWELLVLHNPFAVEYLSDAAQQLRALTGTRVPFQMGDWFVTDAAKAPLYDRILYEMVFGFTADIATMTRFELETALGVDVDPVIAAERADNLDEVVRAGFQVSGVSEQNRVIERHGLQTQSTGAYWISYDFKSEAGFGDIFTHPLDFVEDGGEIIWNLPNKLQAYLLVNSVGQRVDVADVDIVNNKEDNGAVITNGASCMGCHYQGMRLASDEVGPYVAEFGDFGDLVLQQVANLYSPNEALEAELEADIEWFLEGMAATNSPPLHDGGETVSAVSEAFDDVPLDLRRMAAEFGMEAGAFGNKIAKLPIGLQKISSMPVDRASMRLDYAAAACILNNGVTVACPAP